MMHRDSSMLACVLGIFTMGLGLLMLYLVSQWEWSNSTLQTYNQYLGGFCLIIGVFIVALAITIDLLGRD